LSLIQDLLVSLCMQVTHVLATRVSTDTLAGLPGMLLSQVDPGADYGKAGGAQVAASVTGTDRQASARATAALQCTPAWAEAWHIRATGHFNKQCIPVPAS